jgi:hypothetical protein
MAIIGPELLPAVLKLQSDPLKFEVISQLGHPVVLVEIDEAQLEQAIRTTGDFIAQFFPLEEKVAYFQTQPLVSSYDIPADAYWIRDVKWDPATTRIGDIFGAESFLFCFPKATKILDKDGALQDVREWKGPWKAKTPYGSRQLNIFKRKSDHLQPARQIIHDAGNIVTTINHPIECLNRKTWLTNQEFVVGDTLRGANQVRRVVDFKNGGIAESYSIDVPRAQCFYAAYEGEPILVH